MSVGSIGSGDFQNYNPFSKEERNTVKEQIKSQKIDLTDQQIEKFFDVMKDVNFPSYIKGDQQQEIILKLAKELASGAIDNELYPLQTAVNKEADALMPKETATATSSSNLSQKVASRRFISPGVATSSSSASTDSTYYDVIGPNGLRDSVTYPKSTAEDLLRLKMGLPSGISWADASIMGLGIRQPSEAEAKMLEDAIKGIFSKMSLDEVKTYFNKELMPFFENRLNGTQELGQHLRASYMDNFVSEMKYLDSPFQTETMNLFRDAGQLIAKDSNFVAIYTNLLSQSSRDDTGAIQLSKDLQSLFGDTWRNNLKSLTNGFKGLSPDQIDDIYSLNTDELTLLYNWASPMIDQGNANSLESLFIGNKAIQTLLSFHEKGLPVSALRNLRMDEVVAVHDMLQALGGDFSQNAQKILFGGDSSTLRQFMQTIGVSPQFADSALMDFAATNRDPLVLDPAKLGALSKALNAFESPREFLLLEKMLAETDISASNFNPQTLKNEWLADVSTRESIGILTDSERTSIIASLPSNLNVWARTKYDLQNLTNESLIALRNLSNNSPSGSDTEKLASAIGLFSKLDKIAVPTKGLGTVGINEALNIGDALLQIYNATSHSAQGNIDARAATVLLSAPSAFLESIGATNLVAQALQAGLTEIDIQQDIPKFLSHINGPLDALLLAPALEKMKAKGTTDFQQVFGKSAKDYINGERQKYEILNQLELPASKQIELFNKLISAKAESNELRSALISISAFPPSLHEKLVTEYETNKTTDFEGFLASLKDNEINEGFGLNGTATERDNYLQAVKTLKDGLSATPGISAEAIISKLTDAIKKDASITTFAQASEFLNSLNKLSHGTLAAIVLDEKNPAESLVQVINNRLNSLSIIDSSGLQLNDQNKALIGNLLNGKDPAGMQAALNKIKTAIKPENHNLFVQYLGTLTSSSQIDSAINDVASRIQGSTAVRQAEILNTFMGRNPAEILGLFDAVNKLSASLSDSAKAKVLSIFANQDIQELQGFLDNIKGFSKTNQSILIELLPDGSDASLNGLKSLTETLNQFGYGKGAENEAALNAFKGLSLASASTLINSFNTTKSLSIPPLSDAMIKSTLGTDNETFIGALIGELNHLNSLFQRSMFYGENSAEIVSQTKKVMGDFFKGFKDYSDFAFVGAFSKYIDSNLRNGTIQEASGGQFLTKARQLMGDLTKLHLPPELEAELKTGLLGDIDGQSNESWQLRNDLLSKSFTDDQRKLLGEALGKKNDFNTLEQLKDLVVFLKDPQLDSVRGSIITAENTSKNNAMELMAKAGLAAVLQADTKAFEGVSDQSKSSIIKLLGEDVWKGYLEAAAKGTFDGFLKTLEPYKEQIEIYTFLDKVNLPANIEAQLKNDLIDGLEKKDNDAWKLVNLLSSENLSDKDLKALTEGVGKLNDLNNLNQLSQLASFLQNPLLADVRSDLLAKHSSSKTMMENIVKEGLTIIAAHQLRENMSAYGLKLTDADIKKLSSEYADSTWGAYTDPANKNSFPGFEKLLEGQMSDVALRALWMNVPSTVRTKWQNFLNANPDMIPKLSGDETGTSSKKFFLENQLLPFLNKAGKFNSLSVLSRLESGMRSYEKNGLQWTGVETMGMFKKLNKIVDTISKEFDQKREQLGDVAGASRILNRQERTKLKLALKYVRSGMDYEPIAPGADSYFNKRSTIKLMKDPPTFASFLRLDIVARDMKTEGFVIPENFTVLNAEDAESTSKLPLDTRTQAEIDTDADKAYKQAVAYAAQNPSLNIQPSISKWISAAGYKRERELIYFSRFPETSSDPDVVTRDKAYKMLEATAVLPGSTLRGLLETMGGRIDFSKKEHIGILKDVSAYIEGTKTKKTEVTNHVSNLLKSGADINAIRAMLRTAQKEGTNQDFRWAIPGHFAAVISKYGKEKGEALATLLSNARADVTWEAMNGLDALTNTNEKATLFYNFITKIDDWSKIPPGKLHKSLSAISLLGKDQQENLFYALDRMDAQSQALFFTNIISSDVAAKGGGTKVGADGETITGESSITKGKLYDALKEIATIKSKGYGAWEPVMMQLVARSTYSDSISTDPANQSMLGKTTGNFLELAAGAIMNPGSTTASLDPLFTSCKQYPFLVSLYINGPREAISSIKTLLDKNVLSSQLLSRIPADATSAIANRYMQQKSGGISPDNELISVINNFSSGILTNPERQGLVRLLNEGVSLKNITKIMSKIPDSKKAGEDYVQNMLLMSADERADIFESKFFLGY